MTVTRNVNLRNAAIAASVVIGTTLCTMTEIDASGSPKAGLAREIQRGFHVSGSCIHDGESPLQWCVNFQKALLENAPPHRDSDGFLLGAKFGFSFRLESSAEAVGVTQDELRRLAAYATLMRLDFEERKRRLGFSDAEIVKIVGVSAKNFAEWKARALTTDVDRSVVKKQRGLGL